MKFNLKRI